MEAWDTQEKIDAARDRLAAAIPGWRFPTAFGIGRLVGGRAEFARVTTDAAMLPAVVLGTVTGHVAGSASYVVGRAALDRAIALAGPAEAYTAKPHPNIRAWRALRDAVGDDEPVLVVFVEGDPAGDPDDPHVAALRAAA